MKLKRTQLNFAIDLLGLLLMLVLIYTGVILRYLLPPGSGGRREGRGLALLGLDRHEWGGIHFWSAVAVAALLILHVALHWSWVCGLLKVREPRRVPRTGIVFGCGLALALGGLTWWAAACIEVRESGPVARSHESPGARSNQNPGARSNDNPGARSNQRLDPAIPTTSPRHPPDRPAAARAELVRGRMTLREVADASGVPVDALRRSLGLPAEVSEHERLGRLGRRYGFPVEKVRDAIAAHKH